MRLLVAGASGLIGREVSQLLKASGHYVRTVSKDPARAEKLRTLVDDVRCIDATVDAALAGVCDGIDVVVSALGAPVSPSASGSQGFHAVDGKVNRALLAEAKRAGVRRFVYVGVFTTGDYAETRYVQAHTDVEQAIREAGLEYGFVRPTGVFGALAEFVSLARKGRVPLFGDGLAETNPVHERDVAEAVVRAVSAPGSSTVEIGGPDTLTRQRIAELAFEALGARPRFLPLPVWLARVVAWLYGLASPRMGEFLAFAVQASTHRCVAPALGTRKLDAYYREVAEATR
jgi:uncharacterized protein YbjT (DUF2867 family)